MIKIIIHELRNTHYALSQVTTSQVTREHVSQYALDLERISLVSVTVTLLSSLF